MFSSGSTAKQLGQSQATSIAGSLYRPGEHLLPNNRLHKTSYTLAGKAALRARVNRIGAVRLNFEDLGEALAARRTIGII